VAALTSPLETGFEMLLLQCWWQEAENNNDLAPFCNESDAILFSFLFSKLSPLRRRAVVVILFNTGCSNRDNFVVMVLDSNVTSSVCKLYRKAVQLYSKDVQLCRIDVVVRLQYKSKGSAKVSMLGCTVRWPIFEQIL
jgi:hypothetical protein